jgi:hypothetical protein
VTFAEGGRLAASRVFAWMSMGSDKQTSTRRAMRAAFDYALDFEAVDFRKRPDLYRIGKG